MAAVAEFHQLSGWKVYTHSPNGWFLDDHDPDLPAVGEAFLAQVEAIGPPVVAVHKGLAGGSPYASPVDIGPAAMRHPDVSFLVYHSGFEHAVREGLYDPEGNGADRLVRSLADAGVAPGSNVYAELGSTWRAVMGDPDEAAHLLGKLLLALGEDNVLWGTDSIWYGSPQDQIAAFRTFEIAPQLQEQFGYPALTPEAKAKILGGNAARLLGVNPPAAACTPPAEREAAGEESALGNVTLGPVSRRDVLRAFVGEHPWVV
jgi:predicted TIM-barrel fold metal-dependent hydrolase